MTRPHKSSGDSVHYIYIYIYIYIIYIYVYMKRCYRWSINNQLRLGYASCEIIRTPFDYQIYTMQERIAVIDVETPISH